jgi:hypothetical protein
VLFLERNCAIFEKCTLLEFDKMLRGNPLAFFLEIS